MFPARVQALYRIPRIPISSLDFPANFFQSFRPMTMMILATKFPYILHQFSSMIPALEAAQKFACGRP